MSKGRRHLVRLNCRMSSPIGKNQVVNCLGKLCVHLLCILVCLPLINPREWPLFIGKSAADGRKASLARFACRPLSPYPPGDCAHR
jgi:hypothetical protein